MRTTVSTSGSSGIWQLDEDVSVADDDGVGFEAASRVAVMLAGGAIEFPGVPRAHEHASVEGALAQGSARMGAESVDGIHLVFDTAKDQVLERMRLAGSDFV